MIFSVSCEFQQNGDFKPGFKPSTCEFYEKIEKIESTLPVALHFGLFFYPYMLVIYNKNHSPSA
jgi:hypothetical protein